VLLPLPIFIILFLGLAWLGAEVTGVVAWSTDRDSLPDPNWAIIRVGRYGVLCVALTITAAFTCYLARRSYCGFKWAATGCTVVYCHALFFYSRFEHPLGAEYSFLIGYTLGRPTLHELIGRAVPLLVFVLYFFLLRRAQLTKASD
jgi:hypothetical protein